MKSRFWLAGVICCWVMGLSSGISFGDTNEEVLVLHPDANGIQRAFMVLDSYAFTPSHISVEAGMPIELQLENRSFLTPHDFVIDHPETDLRHDVSVDAGDRATIQFLVRTPGTYTFYCDKQLLFFSSHREEGMEGRLEVRPSGQ